MPRSGTPTTTIGGVTMSEPAAAALQAYYDMGPSRTLARLAESYTDPAGRRYSLGQLRQWAHRYCWTEAVGALASEEIATARAAALKERARLAEKRIRQAAELQDYGMQILDQSAVDDLLPEEARRLINHSIRMIELGMRMERLELGEATTITDVRDIRPPKPIKDMTDDELTAWRQQLEQLKGVA
jgi:hypothetical protein